MTESMEDLEPLVTRCPHCSTRFRVSEAQLQVAKGRVRCGACLTVFVGIDHLQWDLEQDVAIANPDQSIDQLLGEIDEFELDEVSVPAADEPVAPGVELAGSPGPDGALDAISTDSEIPQSVEDIERVVEANDEVAAPIPEPELELRDNASNELDLPENPDWLETQPIEVELPIDPFDRLSHETALEESIAEFGELESAAQAELPEPEPQKQIRSDPVTADPITASQPMQPRVVEDLASVALEAPRRSRFQRWRGVLFIVALVLIAGQVVWYLLPSWISDPEKRWLPEQVCEVVGCKLEPLRDLSQLLLTNVVVRAHPDRPEVRQIDLLLVNSGTFDQAFPDIEITFSTPAGDRVAWKRFTPVQYLAGDMTNASAIPRKTPVRISLAVTDPGTLAYSYEITLK